MIKKGDKVIITTGKDKKKSGEVTKVFPKEGRVIVSGINIKKRHRRSTRKDGKGQIIDIEFPVHVSNVKIEDSK